MMSKIFYVLLLLCAFTNYDCYAKRIAIIIGNTYSSNNSKFARLTNASNEVEAVKAKLLQLNFMEDDIITCLDMPKADLEDKISTWIKNSKNGDVEVAVLYYSGHGRQEDGELYLIPNNCDLESLSTTALNLQNYRKEVSKDVLSFFFIEACREGTNPGEMRPVNLDAKSRTTPRGNILITSCEAGDKTKSDGKFTECLVENLGNIGNLTDFICSITASCSAAVVYNQGVKGDFYWNPQTIKETETLALNQSNSTTTNTTSTDKTSTGGTSTNNDNKDRKEIKICAIPANAKLYVGGKEFDMSSTLLYKIGATYSYSVKADGYIPHYGKIDVTEDSPEVINITLEKMVPCILNLTSNVEADVSVDYIRVGKSTNDTPLRLELLTGPHYVTTSRTGYYSETKKLFLNPGVNSSNSILRKKPTGFFDLDLDDASHYISGVYSPQYNYGAKYMIRPYGSSIAFGLFTAFSSNEYKYSESETSSLENSVVAVSKSVCQKNLNILLLYNSGIQFFNGFMLETGIGAGSYENNKWSFAARVGGTAFIPLDGWEKSLSIGAGYTWLTSRNRYGSWDISLGYSWKFY